MQNETQPFPDFELGLPITVMLSVPPLFIHVLFMKMLIKDVNDKRRKNRLVGWFFYGISTLMDYLMPNPIYT